MLDQCTMDARSAGRARSDRICFFYTLQAERILISLQRYAHLFFLNVIAFQFFTPIVIPAVPA